MKETSLFRIYIEIVYEKGDVFLRRKLEIFGVLALLVCAVIGSQRVSEYLYRHYMSGEGRQTAANVKKGGKMLIVIDPGHGGSDPGKVGVNQALEKDINLAIANKVNILLEKQGFSVIMTRENEEGLANSKVEDMKERVHIINKTKPDLAVSIHQNSYGGEGIHGAQVFYYSHSKEGEKAANTMQNALLAADTENTRAAKANDTYYMLKRTKVPVIIVECGFLSNRAEANKLIDKKYQDSLAEAICQGIQNCLKDKDLKDK